jgi:cell division transport system permease protein
MYTAWYLVRNGFKGLGASWLVTSMSTLTISVALVLIGFFLVFVTHVGSLVDHFSESLRLTVYLKADTPERDMLSFKQTLEEMDAVEDVRFVAPEEVEAEVQELLGKDLVAGLPREALPLQPAVEIQLRGQRITTEKVNDILGWISRMKEVQWVDEVVHGLDRYRLILVLIDSFRYLGVLIASIVILAALFFVYSNIRLAVLARGDEIGVMRLVGATNGFIKTPFFLQGGVQGLAGGVIALILVAFLNSHVQTTLTSDYLVSLQLDLLPPGVAVLFLLGGVSLGLLGTWMSVGKYLKI